MQKVSCSIFRTFRSKFEPNSPGSDYRHHPDFFDSSLKFKKQKAEILQVIKEFSLFPTALQFALIAKDWNFPETLSLSYNIGNLYFLLELLEQINQGFSIFQTLGRIFYKKLLEENSKA